MALIVEKDFSEMEITECKLLYDSLVKSHEICNGTGLSHIGNGIADCDCEAVFKYLKSMIYSRLPRRFWAVDYDSRKDLFEDAKDISSIEKMFNEGKIKDSFFVMGDAGRGKTAAMVLIGKIAIWNKLNVFYLTSEDLLDFIRKDSENKIYLDRLSGADIILFDNLTGYHKSEWATGQIEFNLRKFHDNGANIIISSPTVIEDLIDVLSMSLVNFLSRINKIIVVDYKGKGELRLNQFLEKPILLEARKYFRESLEVS